MNTDTYYHVYNHANGEENLFRSDENYRFFLQQWAKYIEPVAGTYAYCLMPNHFHALVKVHKAESLLDHFKLTEDLTGFENLSGLISQQFSNLFNAYAKAFNKHYDRRGSLFNRPFKRKEITSEAYLTAIITYIHRNPVHHGFCENPQDWPHSSFEALISARPTKLDEKRGSELVW